jgi:hypothetical protein
MEDEKSDEEYKPMFPPIEKVALKRPRRVVTPVKSQGDPLNLPTRALLNQIR